MISLWYVGFFFPTLDIHCKYGEQMQKLGKQRFNSKANLLVKITKQWYTFTYTINHISESLQSDMTNYTYCTKSLILALLSSKILYTQKMQKKLIFHRILTLWFFPSELRLFSLWWFETSACFLPACSACLWQLLVLHAVCAD